MVSPNLFKKYYCKIKGKNYGPLTLEELKGLAIQGQLQISDKVSLTFPTKEWLQASSIAALNEIFKSQDYSVVAVDAFDGFANNEGNQSGFTQGVNLGLLEKNSIEIFELLKNINELLEAIKGWVTFMGIVLVIYIICSIILAVLMNPTLSHR